MASSPKGNGAATTARATSASPSLFQVPATRRNGAGSFAAVGRDAGLKTGAPSLRTDGRRTPPEQTARIYVPSTLTKPARPIRRAARASAVSQTPSDSAASAT